MRAFDRRMFADFTMTSSSALLALELKKILSLHKPLKVGISFWDSLEIHMIA